MTRWVLLASTRPDAETAAVDGWLADVSALTGSGDVLAADAGRALPGSVADADVTADLLTDDLITDDPLTDHANQSINAMPAVAEIVGASCLASVEALALTVIAARRVDLDGPRIKRTLALSVRAGTPEHDVERFERSLSAMPDHIREIRSWSLSRVDPTRSNGRWTHVWEQEYARVDGVRVAYLQHPYHWTGVDRWFDPEMPCSIVEPKLAHLFRWVDRPIVAVDQ